MNDTREEWEELKRLFNAAVEMAAGEREAYMARVRQSHPHLELRLRTLLASHADQESGFLEQPAIAGASVVATVEPATVAADIDDGLAVGDVLDHTYEVDARIGHGGMGLVYKVRHRGLGRVFAAKVIHSSVNTDERFVSRFAREAEALGRLKHPHIVDVTDFGVDRQTFNRPYLVMECLEGRTLQDRLTEGPLPMESALAPFDAIASALDYAHEQGVLHLDLKPGNIFLVGGSDAASTPKILDFGLAHFLTGSAGELTGSTPRPVLGTPAYMAPEVVRGETPTVSSDIFSLGALMFETLVGHRPFDGESAAEVLDQVRRAVPRDPCVLNPAVSRETGQALLTVLAKQPKARPATARAAVSSVCRAHLVTRQRRWRRIEWPRRAAAAAAIAGGMAMSWPLWQMPPMESLELRTVDARFALAGSRPATSTVSLLMLDDASLAEDATPLVQRADQLGRDLQRVFDAGARAVAVDFLLPEIWSRSAPFAQLVLRHADNLTLAAFSAESGEVIGPEGVAGAITAALGPERSSALFGFVNLDQDVDGVARRARLEYTDREGVLRPAFSWRAVETTGLVRRDSEQDARRAFWIDHRIDPNRIDRVSWKDLDGALRDRPELFRGRLVIAGANFSGSGDDIRVPNRGAVAGAVLHGITAATILEGFPLAEVTGARAAIGTSIAGGLWCALVLFTRRLRRVGLAFVLTAMAYVAASAMIFRTGAVWPVVAPVAMCSLGLAVARAVKRRRPPYPES